jgi:hypothetical protein
MRDVQPSLADEPAPAFLDQVLADLDALNAAVVGADQVSEAVLQTEQTPEAAEYLQRMRADIGRLSPGGLTAGLQLPTSLTRPRPPQKPDGGETR